MLHEIFPQQFSNEFVETSGVGDSDYVLHYYNKGLLLKIEDNNLAIPTRIDIGNHLSLMKTTYLFSLNGIACFLIWDENMVSSAGFVYKEISFFRTFQHMGFAWSAVVGYQLMNWYTQNRYCGSCGAINKEKANERALVCTNCKATIYPKISPAIIVAILDGDKILLARNSNFIHNWYSLIAGYADIGESLEEAVQREVKEEVGLEVHNIRYYKSQPWPFSSSMMIGFFADVVNSREVCIDNKEITEAAWFKRGELPNHPPTISIAGEMIELFNKDEVVS